MNETTLFLAQIMGPTIGILGLGMLFNQKYYRKIFNTIGSEDFDMFLTPLILITLGAVLVREHFLWGSFPEVLVSIMGLGMFVKGAVLALMPKFYKNYVSFVFKKDKMIAFAGIVWLALGVYFTWLGFFAS